MTGRWSYGKAWEQFPIMPGEVWAVGDHHMLCSDLEIGAHHDFFTIMGDLDPLLFPKMAYTDPPWGSGVARAYRTKAHSETEEIVARSVNFRALMWKAMEALSYVEGAVYVEIGEREHLEVIATARDAGYRHLQSWPITYYKTKPCKLALLAREETGIVGPPGEGTPKGLDEPAGWCIFASSEPGDVVFDPFMGQGLVAEEAARLGRIAWGIELNPRRLAVTLMKLAKATGKEPVKVA